MSTEPQLSVESDALAAMTAEQRAEAQLVLGEVMERATNYAQRGRSSMPIRLDEALVLAALSAVALRTPPGSEVEHAYLGWSNGGCSCSCGRRFHSVQEYDAHVSPPGEQTAAQPTGPEAS
jgi:hypothetical protein